MAFEFKLPDIGEGVVEGEVVKWKVAEGDTIQMDQPMVEIMTDKATVEIPAPKAGRVARIMVPEGKLCAVGQVLIVIDDQPNGRASQSVPQYQGPRQTQQAPPHQSQTAAAKTGPMASSTTGAPTGTPAT